MRRAGLLSDRTVRSLDVASRTDRGVSARANALIVPSPLDGTRLLRALNGCAPDIFFTAAHAVPAGFRPRRATQRTYRYLEPRSSHDSDRWREAAGRFVGRMDARSFGRGLPSDRPVWREVQGVSVSTEGPWLVLEITAPSFVWGMVRKIVAALRAVTSGTLTPETLEEAVAGRRRLTLPLAEPEGLILWEVGYPFDFEVVASRFTAHQERYWAREREATRRRAALVERVSPPALGGSGERPPEAGPTAS